MRVELWIFASLATLSARAALVQSVSFAQTRADRVPVAGIDEAPEEIVVRGRQLGEFRVELQLARERAYAIFNEINSTDDFDISCDPEMRTGTRVGERSASRDARATSHGTPRRTTSSR